MSVIAYGLGSRQSPYLNMLNSGVTQLFGDFIERGTRGDHIIHQRHGTLARFGSGIADAKSVF